MPLSRRRAVYTAHFCPSQEWELPFAMGIAAGNENMFTRVANHIAEASRIRQNARLFRSAPPPSERTTRKCPIPSRVAALAKN
jgi:hypothetical protein